MSGIEPDRTLLAFDLDDTLLHEVTYIGAVFEAIAREFPQMPPPHPLDHKKPYLIMGQWSGGDPQILDRMVHIYRTAEGVSPISSGTRDLLQNLKDKGFTLALITDGFTIRQRAKLQLLGIIHLFNEIWISEEAGADKLSGEPFRMIPSRFPELNRFIYVGDNPAKDFEPAHRHSWHTIMLKATPANIHSQHTGTPAERTIDTLSDLLNRL